MNSRFKFLGENTGGERSCDAKERKADMGQKPDINFKYETALIKRSALRYIIPATFALIFEQIAPVVDAVCVSNGLGNEALSSFSNVSPMIWVTNIIGSLGGVGCGIMASKCLGSGEVKKAGRAFTIALKLMIVTTVIYSIISLIFLDPILKFLWCTPENIGYAKEYLTVYLMGAVFVVLSFSGAYILTDDNNPKLALCGSIVAATVNIIIDVTGIFVLGQGIWITAFGTVFSNFCACIIYTFHFRKKESVCRPTFKRESNDPGVLEIIKPGTAQAMMYSFVVLQTFVQNYVLSDSAGTSGLGNSAVIENLTMILAITFTGASEAVMPLTAAYFGEKNRCGQLMVKKTLLKMGLVIVIPLSGLIILFPHIFMAIFSVNDPVMAATLPAAIRITCIASVINFINLVFIYYLTAVEQEKQANIAYVIQSLTSIAAMILLMKTIAENAPWYANLISVTACLVFLLACGSGKGLIATDSENVLLMTGIHKKEGSLSDWRSLASKVLTKEQVDIVGKKMMEPFDTVLKITEDPLCVFLVLDAEDGHKNVILRYDSKTDEDAESEAETEDRDCKCICSEFNSLKRMMIIFDEGDNQ